MFRSPVLLLLFLFFLPIFLPAQDLSRKELEDRRKQLIQEIKLTNRMLSKTQKSRQVTLDRYMALQRQIKAREALLATLRQELQYVEVKLDRTGEVIQALESDLDRLREEYAHMLRMAYRQQATQSGLWFILSATDLNEGFRRWQYLRQYEKYRQKQAERIEETVRTLEEEKIELDARKAEKERLLLAEAHQKEVWAQELVEKNRILQNLKQNESRLTAELKEKRQAHERLNQAIEKIIRAEVARRQEESRNSTMSSVEDEREAANRAVKLTSDFAGNKGKLPWPVKNGVITTSFGRQPHPTLQNITIVNNGIDLLTEKRAQVKAIFSGKVLATQFVPGHDYMLILQHGEYYTVYSNLETVSVNRGQQVAIGQPLGVVRENPRNGNTELHFELWYQKKRLDPSEWIQSRS